MILKEIAQKTLGQGKLIMTFHLVFQYTVKLLKKKNTKITHS